MLNRILIWLAQKLYPNGRAFRMPEPTDTGATYTDPSGDDYTDPSGEAYVTDYSPNSTGGILYRLHRALSYVMEEAWTANAGTLNALMPDNPAFTIADARDWYRRLGIYDSGLVSFSDMKLAIARKLSFPLVPLNKQHYLYIEDQLRAAGFDVRVYKNKFDDGMGGFETRSPATVLGYTSGEAVYGAFNYGEINYGETWADTGVTICANYLEEALDNDFDFGDSYRATFYIAGATVSTFATIDIHRKTEFRQLLLKLKSAQMAAILFVNYS